LVGTAGTMEQFANRALEFPALRRDRATLHQAAGVALERGKRMDVPAYVYHVFDATMGTGFSRARLSAAPPIKHPNSNTCVSTLPASESKYRES
jgi:hypothetical protein